MNTNLKNKKIVEVKDLTKFYCKNKGINKISFQINQGEIYGLMGPNGAGKTTTIRSMLNLITPDSGSTKIFGKDNLSQNEKANISYLPGEYEMYSNLNGNQYLSYISNLRNAKQNNIQKLAEQLDLDLSKKINELSKGNKQKIGIIQTFMNNPMIAILDEPTTGLDPLKQHEFQNIIKEHNKLGCSILLSSHILNEIEDLCEKVGVIKNGELIASEKIAELKNKSIKKYEITFDQKPLKSNLSTIKGISNLKIKETIAGGSVANSIVGLSQLGNVVSFIGKVNDD